MKTPLDTKTGLLILAAVAILVVIVLVAVLSNQSAKNQSVNQLHFTKIDPSALPPGAPLGAVTVASLPPSFPKGLAMDPNAVMTVLNGLPFTTSTAPKAHPVNEYTLEWLSTSSQSALFASYKNYFTQNRWNIIDQSSTAATPYLQATKASSAASVIFMTQAAPGSRVILDYILQ